MNVLVFAAGALDLPRDRLAGECEQAIRNYDPCISRAARFLDLRVKEALPA